MWWLARNNQSVEHISTRQNPPWMCVGDLLIRTTNHQSLLTHDKINLECVSVTCHWLLWSGGEVNVWRCSFHVEFPLWRALQEECSRMHRWSLCLFLRPCFYSFPCFLILYFCTICLNRVIDTWRVGWIHSSVTNKCSEVTSLTNTVRSDWIFGGPNYFSCFRTLT